MLENLKVGDTIDLSDLKTMEREGAVEPVSFEVLDSKIIKSADIVWRLFLLRDLKEDEVWICEKNVEHESELRLYFPIDEFNGFNQGETKREAVEDGARFLFCEPEDPNNFRHCDLEFSEKIDNGREVFHRKFPTMYGDVYHNGEDMFCGVTEYVTEADIDHQELLLFEIGGLDSEAKLEECGGSLYLFHGYKIQNFDIGVFNNAG